MFQIYGFCTNIVKYVFYSLPTECHLSSRLPISKLNGERWIHLTIDLLTPAKKIIKWDVYHLKKYHLVTEDPVRIVIIS